MTETKGMQRTIPSRALRGALVLLLVAAAACRPGADSPRGADGSSRADGPNVLIIMTDDQRPSLATMPKTRRWFKRQGTHFPRAVVTTPTCCPSRASVMSGTYAHNHGVLDSDGWGHHLDQSWTIPRYLSEAGYRTGMFGKYFNEWDPEVDPPHFDEWATMNDGNEHGYRSGTWNVQGEVTTVDTYSTRFIEDRALEFLRGSPDEDRPWYLYVTPWAPHEPAVPDARYVDAPVPDFDGNPSTWEPDRSDKPDYVQDKNLRRGPMRELRARQLRTLMSVDDMVDAIFRQLRDNDELDDTIAFFLSDNGYHWGEQGLRGKRYPYLASLRVPLFVRWPGRFEGGAVDDRLVANIDLAPTIFEAADIEPVHTVDGRSLMSTFDRDRLLIEMWSREDRKNPDWAGLLGRDYVYVDHFAPDRTTRVESEYYDLDADPWQLVNLLGGKTRAGIDTAALAERLAADMRCSGTDGSRACP